MRTRTDHVSPVTRSAIMRAVKSQRTKSTEIRLRAALASNGLRGWKVQAAQLPGKPDFVFLTQKLAIFADGCVWHGCSQCYRRPQSRQDYWDAKVRNNVSRDRRNRSRLRRLGWHTLRVWEHEISTDIPKVCRRIEATLASIQGRKRKAALSS
jgi:DNA mismatch endonuclease (patch repair protein)